MDSIISTINSIPLQYVQIASMVVGGIVIVIFTVVMSALVKQGYIQKSTKALISSGNSFITNRMKKSKNDNFNFDEVEAYINKTGFKYMTNDKIGPVGFILIKVGIATLCFTVGITLNVIAGPVLGLFGYFLLDLILKLSNDNDNEKMLQDIKGIYDTLRIQTKAGVYITAVLSECYLVAENKRLKHALLKLTSDIIAKNDMETSLENFRSRFSNEYINTLAIIIKQSMQTGSASKMFEDIRDQISDIEAALVLQEKQRIARNITIVQVMLYASIILVSILVAVNSLSNGLDF